MPIIVALKSARAHVIARVRFWGPQPLVFMLLKHKPKQFVKDCAFSFSTVEESSQPTFKKIIISIF